VQEGSSQSEAGPADTETVTAELPGAPKPDEPADQEGMPERYRLDVKRSARRASAGAGRWVRDHGTKRACYSKPEACSWARELTRSCGRTVWVQDAHPKDGTADGYLVARSVRPRPSSADGDPQAAAQGSLDSG
jgi:hypothetical protein